MTEIGMLIISSIVVLLTDASNMGRLLGSMLNPVLWVGVFLSFKISNKYHSGNHMITYMYVAVISTILRYVEIIYMLPTIGGFAPTIVMNRLIWSVLGMLMITAVIIGIRKFRAQRRSSSTD